MSVRNAARMGLFAGVALLAAQPQARWQFHQSFSTANSCDDQSCTFSFNSAPGRVELGATAGAPYSGRMITERILTLEDSTQTTTLFTGATTYRDSRGRVRTEQPLSDPEGVKTSDDLAFVEIKDPVAGCVYFLDTVKRIAHRVKAYFNVGTWAVSHTGLVAVVSSSGRYREGTSTSADGTMYVSESLGTKALFGVSATGHRTTTIRPASELGTRDVEETWRDTDMGIELVRSTTRPDRVDTITMKDYSRAEPDRTLFLIPKGYRIVNESGSFKITLPLPN